MIKKTIAVIIAGFLVLLFQFCQRDVTEDPGFEPVVLYDDWEVSTPEAQGVDRSVLENVYQEGLNVSNLYSLLVVKNSFLIAERYFNGRGINDSSPSASVTKSYTSALMGVAIKEQIIPSVDAKLADYFPELDWEGMDPRKSEITLKQMLQMRSGYPWEEFDGFLDTLFSQPDWLPFLEEFPLIGDPGARFGYSNFTAHILAVILAKTANDFPGNYTDLLHFAKEKLFDPLGVTVTYWPSDPHGFYYGSGDITFTPRDMARFGLLYLNGGEYNGEQLIPADWIKDSLTVYSETTYSTEILTSIRRLQYGYLWWSGTSGSHRFFFAWGHGGQMIVVLQDLDMVIVATAEFLGGQFGDGAWQKSKRVMELVGRFIASL